MLAVAVFFLGQRPFLSFAVGRFAEIGFERQGLLFRADSVSAGLFAPSSYRGVDSAPIATFPKRCLHFMRIAWNSLGVGLDGFSLVGEIGFTQFPSKDWMLFWIFASRSFLPATGESGPDEATGLFALLAPGGVWPSVLAIQDGSAEILGENFRYVLNGLELSLNSKAHGRFRLENFTTQVGKFSKVFGPFDAPTTWDQGVAGLAGLELVPGFSISDASLRLTSLEGPSLSFSARIFGGALRGDVNLNNGPRGKVWDVAAFGSNIAVEKIPELFDLTGKASGTLAEGRFTFRGDAARPVDAEASLRVLAKDFRWNNRGWESLEIGASLSPPQIADTRISTFARRRTK
jgi:hypothetical protein